MPLTCSGNLEYDEGPPLFNSVSTGRQAATEEGEDFDKLKKLIELLRAESPLPPQYKDHPLKGNWSGFRDARVEPDWVSIYSVDREEVRFERTGTHEELFED